MAGEPQWKEPSGFTRPKRPKRINPLGKRGRQRIAAMAATPIEGPCEADIVAVCTGTAEHRHHKRRRSQGGSDDRSNLLLCCHACHQWTHANPREARALGFLVFGVDVWSQP